MNRDDAPTGWRGRHGIRRVARRVLPFALLGLALRPAHLTWAEGIGFVIAGGLALAWAYEQGHTDATRETR